MLMAVGCAPHDTAEADRADRAVRIPCAHPGAPLARDCTLERARTDTGTILTPRHPDGAFHRLLVAGTDHAIAAADGAGYTVKATATPQGIAVAVGGDRYLLPTEVVAP